MQPLYHISCYMSPVSMHIYLMFGSFYICTCLLSHVSLARLRLFLLSLFSIPYSVPYIRIDFVSFSLGRELHLSSLLFFFMFFLWMSRVQMLKKLLVYIFSLIFSLFLFYLIAVLTWFSSFSVVSI